MKKWRQIMRMRPISCTSSWTNARRRWSRCGQSLRETFRKWEGSVRRKRRILLRWWIKKWWTTADMTVRNWWGKKNKCRWRFKSMKRQSNILPLKIRNCFKPSNNSSIKGRALKKNLLICRLKSNLLLPSLLCIRNSCKICGELMRNGRMSLRIK